MRKLIGNPAALVQVALLTHIADAQQPIKVARIVLLSHLKAAKQIGLTIPPAVLARADRVIR